MEGVPAMVDDIEDLTADHPLPSDRVRPRQQAVIPKRAKRNKSSHKEVIVDTGADDGSTSTVPGTETIYVRTWGCGHNNSDGEYMAGLLAAYGYAITEEQGEADLWVLNSCAVKAPSEHAFMNMIDKGKSLGKKLVLAGCVPQGESSSKGKTLGMSVVGVQQIDRVVEVVEQTLRGNTVRLMSDKKKSGKKQGGASLALPKMRRNPLVEVIPINTGCLNQCTYCKTKHARGDLGSYPVEDIVNRVKEVIDEGVVEIWLTSEDTGAYGRDIGTNIVELLKAILDCMSEGTMLRLGMTNPPYILEHVEAIADLLKHPRMYTYLHVPVQAGSDEILYAMRREYTRDDFKYVVDYIRENAPGVTIATDIIAGFPGETEDDFDETYKLCEKYKFPCLYINQFFPRPGTPAAAMEKCDTKMVKARTKRLSTLFQSYFPHKDKVGNVYQVLTAEESTDKQYYVSHNKTYDQILVPKRPELLGRVFDVKIVEAGKFHMIGEVIEESLKYSPPRRTPLPRGTVSGAKGIKSKAISIRRRRNGEEKPPIANSDKTGSSVAEKVEVIPKDSNSLWPQDYRTRIIMIALLLLLIDLARIVWTKFA